MRYSSSEFNFTSSPCTSFGTVFTPSPSQSSSFGGFPPQGQTPPSVSSRTLSPDTPEHSTQTTPVYTFGGRNNSGQSLFPGFGMAAVAGPSTDSNMAPRSLSSGPRVMPDRSINHNITREPRVVPVPTVNLTGIFGGRARETRSLSSHTETGSVTGFQAGRAVNLSERTDNSNASLLDEDDGEDNGEEEVNDGDDDEAEEAADDLSSPDPIDDHALQNSLNTLKLKLQGLSREIYNYQLARDPETRLHQIHQETKKLSEFKDQETRIVGFIGETGAGKSSVINSILDQRGLARSSGAGAACTSVPMEYRYVDENHPRPYTIEADFMNETEVNDLLEELLRSIRRATIQTDRSLIAEENWEQYEAIGRGSHETLKAIFCNQSDLTIEYLSRPEAELEILQELKQLAMDRLTFRPGGSSSLQYCVVAGDLETCKDELDRLTNDTGDGNVPALWPFIKLIRVFLELPVLKNGLVLADLPGLRDTNHARIRATERYLASTCDEVFIVAGILRCVSNESIYETIKKCGTTKRIRVVCTRADETSPEESARGNDLFAGRVKKMNAEIRKLETEANRIGRQRQRAQGQEKAELAVIESTTEDKIQQLRYERQAYIMNEKNDSTKEALTRAIHNKQEHRGKDIKIFCVGNELYGNPPHRLADEYRNLSGVRELRAYCRSVPAEARMASALFFIENQVPALLRSIHQWTLTGRDSVTSGGARELRRVLEQMEGDLREGFTSSRGRLARIQNGVHSTFDTQVMHQLQDSQFLRDLKGRFVAVSQLWENLHFASYAAFCRQNGTHTTQAAGSRCWNDELMKEARAVLGYRWDAIETWIMAQRNALHRDISASFRVISDTLQEHVPVAPQAIGNLLYVLDHRERCIKHIFILAVTRIIQSTEFTRDHTLNGHNNSSLIADLMRDAYNRCNRESGTGSARRRRDIMHSHLSNMQLYRKYADSVQSSYHAALNEAFAALREKLDEQIELIARDLRGVVVPAGEVSEVEKVPVLVREFAVRLRTLKRVLCQASEAAKAVGC